MSTGNTTRSSRWAVVALIIVILTAVGAGVVILVSQRGSSRSIESLSTAFMQEVAARAEAATLAHLEVGPASLEVLHQLVRVGELAAEADPALEHQFRSLLAAHDEIEMLNLGLPNGDFMMVKRMPDSSLSTKWVRRRGDVAESRWQHDNPAWSRDGPYADRRENASEAYDPSARPWYRQAAESGELSWVEPYIYYSDRMPGIACALPLYGAEGRLLAVVGADLGIAELSRLLATFQVGRSGQAVILTDDGRLIAYPAFSAGGSELVQEVAGADRSELVLRRVEDSADRVLTAAFARRPTVGADGEVESFTYDIDGTAYVARFEPFDLGSGQRWIVGVMAPQEDFMGTLRRDHTITMAVTLLCLVLAIGLAVALVMRAAALEIELLEARRTE